MIQRGRGILRLISAFRRDAEEVTATAIPLRNGRLRMAGVALTCVACGGAAHTSGSAPVGGAGADGGAGAASSTTPICDGSASARLRIFAEPQNVRELRGSIVRVENGYPSLLIDCRTRMTVVCCHSRTLQRHEARVAWSLRGAQRAGVDRRCQTPLAPVLAHATANLAAFVVDMSVGLDDRLAGFERLCRDLWASIWDDPNTQMHGRGGQEQAGVDIYGQPRTGSGYSAVQCKRQRLGQRGDFRA